MLTTPKLTVYLLFITTLAIWLGGGVFDSLRTNLFWYLHPVASVRTVTEPEGQFNPWPLTTALLALTTLAGLSLFARYQGPGRRTVLGVLISTFLILLVTGLYFVPTLIKLAQPTQLSDAQIIGMSRTWVSLNLIRMALLLGIFFYALLGLMQLVRPWPAPRPEAGQPGSPA